jgi:hypothetical protein
MWLRTADFSHRKRFCTREPGILLIFTAGLKATVRDSRRLPALADADAGWGSRPSKICEL